MDIKSVTVTGGKAVFNPVVDAEGADGEKKRLRRTRKQPVAYRVTGKLDEHGEIVGGGAVVSLPQARALTTSTPPEIKTISVKPVVPAAPTSDGADTPTTLSSPTTKVLLGGKKPHRVKVLLTKKRRADEPGAGKSGGAGPDQKQKPARKIQVGLGAMKKNVTRAKRITRSAKTLPIETIRAELVKAGIIKESSKAPEGVLRQMYADAKTVSTRSL